MKWNNCNKLNNSISGHESHKTHIWNIVKDVFSDNHKLQETIEHLNKLLTEEWDAVSEYDVKRLVFSMSNRVRALYKAREGNTRN